MFSQKQKVKKGMEIGHSSRFERHPDKREHQFVEIGHMVGMIYDTTGWPRPDDVCHLDNYGRWHCDDPNVPPLTMEQLDEDEAIRRKWDAMSKAKKRQPSISEPLRLSAKVLHISAKTFRLLSAESMYASRCSGSSKWGSETKHTLPDISIAVS